jgi:adenine-specific DNA-methyltransferase
MKLIVQTPQKALKAFIKQRPLRSEIDKFKVNLIAILDKINTIENLPNDETEEHLKNNVRDFLLDTYYKETNEINTKDKKDLVIYLGTKTDSPVGVIIEAKRPSNEKEMVTPTKASSKALWELILYYFDERIKANNAELKQLIITNINQWYIIDANYFDKHIYRNNQIKKLYELKQTDKKDNTWFYEEINKTLAALNLEIPCVGFDIRNYSKVLRNADKDDDRELIALYKILSPQHLLKQVTPNDSNSLSPAFYKELLHIIGLEEAKEGGKSIIRRKLTERNEASLIEATIEALNTEDIWHRIPDLSLYGANKEERTFNIALELCITWINRILFLKLLEGQLINYHRSPLEKARGVSEYRFLNNETIHDYDELFKLFHRVLAVNIADRSDSLKVKYSKVPYLNSSLFEISELEDQTIKVNSLDNSALLELLPTTVLKTTKKQTPKLPTLQYLQEFLDAYNFASEGEEDIQEDNKTIITASVLGKVFEKINGYKDGSVFTPSFITMYMCRKSIRLAVVQKFKDYFAANNPNITAIDSIEDIRDVITNKVITRQEANKIINSLKICDPAVGSGHFLVSALNEIIVIKSELNILLDEEGKTLRDYEIEIINDELIITDENGKLFAYNPENKESNRVQKTLFQEKQTIIENCLFGVDINPNSVKICRLRLWIELLKNAYYKPSIPVDLSQRQLMELETLPNIDINIKCGNSLISRFALDADLSKALKSIKYDINAYRGFVHSYKNEKSREAKRGLIKIIDGIKQDFRTEISKFDPKQLKLNKASGELLTLLSQTTLLELSAKDKKLKKEKQKKLETDIEKLTKEIEEIKSNAIYKNAFEWRFEFPEVLDDKGVFVGFDLVVGNPPYIQLQSMGKDADALEALNYKTYSRTGDIYSLFYEKGNEVLRKNGVLSFITSNKWMRADYGLNTRNYIVEQTNPVLLIDFGMLLVFDNATVLSNILSFTKGENENNLLAARTPNDYDLKSDLNSFFNENNVRTPVSKDAWIIQSKSIQNIKGRIEKAGVKLKDWNIKINRGILTGYNEAFIIDEQTKNKLTAEDEKCKHFIKPILRGQDIKAWQPQFGKLWVIYIPKGYTIKNNIPPINTNILAEPTPRYGNMNEKDAWSWFKNELPSLAAHLVKFKIKAEARLDKGDFYWEQRACSYLDEFEKPKIIYPNMTKFLPFVYDESKFITNQKCFIITTEDNSLKYLTAFLNSKIFKFCFKDNFPELLGNTFELSKVFFEQVPVKQISETAQQPFITLVDQIIAAKQQNQDTKALEAQIDQMVYKLYELTDEEIKIVEG